MFLIKKENWWLYLILNVLTLGLFSFVFAKVLKVYEKGAWYTNWSYWTLGVICGIFPALIMLLIFYIQTSIKICLKLNVAGKNIYALPYFWILFVIIPIVGWVLFVLMLVYILLAPSLKIMQGELEKSI